MGRKRIVYCVEDDEDDRSFFKEAIAELGFPVILQLFEMGKDFLDHLENADDQLPDFLFLDLNMPIVTGHDILKRLKAHPKWSTIPVAICSTSSSEEDIRKTFQMGANIYIVKPNSFQILQTALKRLLITDYRSHATNQNWDKFLFKL
ncbi:MAG: response regulator [Sediminicola sp.]